MRVLGVDPGTRICGYGIIEANGADLKAVDYGVVKASKKESLAQRLQIIHTALKTIIEKHEPDVVAVEGAFYGVNARTAIKIGEARGVALLAATSADLEAAEYPPATVKKAVAGNGRAQKSQVQKMVQIELSLPELPSPQDASDALAIAICHCHRQRFKDLT